ncbi:IclR family transcriptional regulator [Bradyrhizobium genosp. P]|uniref:IclR family transcriptional regulator n=1 Tax=Bradyrhizobium genosp. P TaxID=83641 RepID=UPI003CF62C4C
MVLRLLRALTAADLLIQDSAAGCWNVGARSLRLAALLQSSSALVQVAQPILQALVHEVGEGVTLNAYSSPQGAAINVAFVESQKPLHYVIEPGELKYLHAGASGKAILAFLAPAERAAALAKHGLRAITPRTPVVRAKLDRDLAAIRTAGFVITHGERLPGAVGIGAPVFGVGGKVLASMVVTVPEHRAARGAQALCARAVRAAAVRPSTALGCQIQPSRRRA